MGLRVIAASPADTPQPCDAGVVFVWNDRSVNLIVTDHMGGTHVRTGVTLLQPGDMTPFGAHAAWMPYQAAKAEAEKQTGPVAPFDGTDAAAPDRPKDVDVAVTHGWTPSAAGEASLASSLGCMSLGQRAELRADLRELMGSSIQLMRELVAEIDADQAEAARKARVEAACGELALALSDGVEPHAPALLVRITVEPVSA